MENDVITAQIDKDHVYGTVIKKRKRSQKPKESKNPKKKASSVGVNVNDTDTIIVQKTPPNMKGQIIYYCAYCKYCSIDLDEVIKHRTSVHGGKPPKIVNKVESEKTVRKAPVPPVPVPAPTRVPVQLPPVVKKISTGPIIGKLKCVKCDKYHLSALYPCQDCNFVASCLTEVKEHVAKSHDNKPAHFLCPFCAIQFRGIAILESHLVAKHVAHDADPLALFPPEISSVVNRVIGDVQPKVFSKKKLIYRSPWIYMLKKYTCSKSGCKYVDYSLLDSVQHEKEHIYKNFWLPYCLHVCTKCGFESRLQNVVTHMVVKHPQIKEKEIGRNISLLMFELGRVWFMCRSCGVIFSSIRAISEHLDLKHIVPGFDPTANTPQIKAMLAELWVKHVQEIRNCQWDIVNNSNKEIKLFSRSSVCVFDVLKTEYISRCLSNGEYESISDDE